MFWEVWIQRHDEYHFFRSHENALEFAREQVNEITNWTTDEIEEALTQLENEDYVEDFIYLTERSFED